MKTLVILVSLFLYTIPAAQVSQPDTLNLYDTFCEANNPHEIDTTLFSYRDDTLYIRNIRNGFCNPEYYRAVAQKENDTLKIDIVNIAGGMDCLADCSMGYTMKISLPAFDSLNLKLIDEYFTINKADIVMSVSRKMVGEYEIYPNPVEGSLSIKGNGIEKIEIRDVNGNVLVSKLESFGKIDLSNLRAGMYFVAIYTANNYLTKKIIKK